MNRQQVELDLAISKLTRDSILIDKGLISQEEYDVSLNTIEKLRADMNITRVDISKTYVRSPFSGIVGLRNFSRGAYVTPANVLTTIQDVGKIKLDFSIPEKYIYNFQTGQTITFMIDGISGEFTGQVYAYEPRVENNTRSLVIRAIVDNQGKKLLPGTFANVIFKMGGNNNAIMIPSQSVVPKLKGQSIFVIKDGKAKSIDIELGERKADMVQIISGNIISGDSIITTNILRLRNEALVKVATQE
jgi:membrane fusion protein (multidrug efflux system)